MVLRAAQVVQFGLKVYNDGILNYLINCHFSKEGLEEYELRDFGLIIRRGAEKISLK